MDGGKFSRRKGTTDFGKPYEQKVAAWLGTKCVLHDDIQDMSMATNVDKLGAFDDFVLFTKKRKGKSSYNEVCLIQVKHTGNKNLYLSAGKNDLYKYQKSYLEIKEDFLKGNSPLQDICEFENIKFILFTNTQINTGENISLNEYTDPDDIVNTGQTFKICNDATNFYDSDFLKQTFLYCNQIDVSKVEDLIKTETGKYFENCNVGQVMKFFEDWHSGLFENKMVLQKEDIQSIFLEIILLNYVPHPTMTAFPKADIWNEVAKQFHFLVLKDDKHVPEIWQAMQLKVNNLLQDRPIDLLHWTENFEEPSIRINVLRNNFLRQQYPIRKDKHSYQVKDLYVLLWQVCGIPLILNPQTDTVSSRNISAALEKLDPSNIRRYIFLGQSITNFRQNAGQFSIIDTYGYIQDKVLQNACISLQGKKAITLEDLKLKETVLEKITPDLLIELLQTNTDTMEVDRFYVSRFIRQPTVSINVLNILKVIQNVVFVIVTSRDIHTSLILLSKFGLVLPWYAYKVASQLTYHQFKITQNFYEKRVSLILVSNENINNMKVYTDIENSILKLRRDREQTVHYFNLLSENKLEWLHSNRNVNQIKPYLISSDSSDYLSESKLFHYLTFNILCGNAGEGKSTLLQFLANHSPADTWVIKLKMRDIIEYIDAGEFSTIEKFLYDQSNENLSRYQEFSWELFLYFCKELKFLITIDGIDEVEFNTNTEKFLNAIKSFGGKVIIATRPSQKESLEQKLHVSSLFLKPFEVQECQSLVKRMLQHNYCETKTNQLNEFVKRISLWNDIVGVPLLLKLFTSVLNDGNQLDLNNFHVTDLFGMYIDEQLRKVSSCNAFTKRTLSKSALFVFYKKEYVSELFPIDEYYDQLDDKIQTLTNSKLVKKCGSNRIPVFAHKSIAEFLAARYLSQLTEKDIDIVKRDFLKSLFYKELETVRLFFDMLTLKGSVLFNVIAGSVNIDLSEFNSKSMDKFGRSALHIAASYGFRCELNTVESLWPGVRIYEFYNKILPNDKILPCPMFERRVVVSVDLIHKLLNSGLDPFQKDTLYNMDVFDYAVKSGSLEMIDKLYKENFVKELVNVNSDILLYSVVQNGYVNIFRRLNNKHVRLQILPAYDSLLHVALAGENFEIICELTKSEINVDQLNAFGHTPLLNWMLSSKVTNINNNVVTITISMRPKLDENQLKILYHLIQRKVNLNRTNSFGETILHRFCLSQEKSVIEKLIQNGCDVNIPTNVKNLPLHYAAQYSLENVKLLLNHNSYRDTPNIFGYTPLCFAAETNSIDIVKYLISKGALINRNRNQMCPLNAAVMKGHVDCAILLMNKHAKINNTQRNNTLELAVTSGNLNCVKELINRGANVYKKLLDVAVFLNCKDIVEFLLSEKLLDIRTFEKDESPLFRAVGMDNVDLIEILISYGADINVRDMEGLTPLHRAALNGLANPMKILIDHHANIKTRSNNGQTPLLTAAGVGSLMCLKILVNNDHVNTEVLNQVAALTMAAGNGHLECVKFLVDKGSDLRKFGQTALYYAAYSKHIDVVNYLTRFIE